MLDAQSQPRVSSSLLSVPGYRALPGQDARAYVVFTCLDIVNQCYIFHGPQPFQMQLDLYGVLHYQPSYFKTILDYCTARVAHSQPINISWCCKPPVGPKGPQLLGLDDADKGPNIGMVQTVAKRSRFAPMGCSEHGCSCRHYRRQCKGLDRSVCFEDARAVGGLGQRRNCGDRVAAE
jgi:hypothetical protein